jgi:hypothetical protein
VPESLSRNRQIVAASSGARPTPDFPVWSAIGFDVSIGCGPIDATASLLKYAIQVGDDLCLFRQLSRSGTHGRSQGGLHLDEIQIDIVSARMERANGP